MAIKVKNIIVVFLSIFSVNTYSAVNEYNICTAGGYYTGADDKFLSGMAMHIAVKRGVFGDERCSAEWRSAFETGKYFSHNGKFRNQSDKEIAKLASKFSSQVYESISVNIDY